MGENLERLWYEGGMSLLQNEIDLNLTFTDHDACANTRSKPVLTLNLVLQ